MLLHNSLKINNYDSLSLLLVSIKNTLHLLRIVAAYHLFLEE